MPEGNLVNAIMNEMEQENGPFNEEKGQFARQAQPMPAPRKDASVMREKLIGIIKNNPELDDLINNSPNNIAKINEILGSEPFLEELFEEPTIIPQVIKRYLADEAQESHESPPAVQEQPSSPVKSRKIHETQEERPQEFAPKVNEFSFAEFMVGPVLAAIAFFLVQHTPLLYYIGQLPYVGALLVGNKLITSIALVMGIFIIGGFGIELVGLI